MVGLEVRLLQRGKDRYLHDPSRREVLQRDAPDASRRGLHLQPGQEEPGHQHRRSHPADHLRLPRPFGERGHALARREHLGCGKGPRCRGMGEEGGRLREGGQAPRIHHLRPDRLHQLRRWRRSRPRSPTTSRSSRSWRRWRGARSTARRSPAAQPSPLDRRDVLVPFPLFARAATAFRIDSTAWHDRDFRPVTAERYHARSSGIRSST